MDLEAPAYSGLDPALVDQGHKGVQGHLAALLRPLSVKAAPEHGQPLHRQPLAPGEKIPGRVGDGAQAALAFRHVAGTGLQKVQALFDPAGNLVRLQDRHPGCRQLDGKRHPLDRLADVGDG